MSNETKNALDAIEALNLASPVHGPAAQGAVQFPKARDLFLRDDMGQGRLRVMFDGDNDVIVAIWPEGGPSVSLEFCNGFNGGGKSPKTRLALIALMCAMEADGAGGLAESLATPSQPSSAEPVADLGELFDGAQKHIAHGVDLRRRLDNEEPPMPSVLSDWIQYAMTYMQIAYQRDGAPPVSNAQWFAAWRVAFPAPVAQWAATAQKLSSKLSRQLRGTPENQAVTFNLTQADARAVIAALRSDPVAQAADSGEP